MAFSQELTLLTNTYIFYTESRCARTMRSLANFEIVAFLWLEMKSIAFLTQVLVQFGHVVVEW